MLLHNIQNSLERKSGMFRRENPQQHDFFIHWNSLNRGKLVNLLEIRLKETFHN